MSPECAQPQLNSAMLVKKAFLIKKKQTKKTHEGIFFKY